MKNKKAQTMGLAILSALAIFIIGFMFINFLLPEVSNFRINLNCADASAISDGTKLLCLIGDTTIPYVIWGIISLGIGAVLVRLKL